MFCPRCRSVSLKQSGIELKNTQIDCCPTCKGVWFDAGELEKVSELAAKDLQIPDGSQNHDRACPKCRQLLHVFNYPGTLVQVDMCASCRGIWLDGGELGEIKVVRLHMQKKNQSGGDNETAGIKNRFICLVDDLIDRLTDFSYIDD